LRIREREGFAKEDRRARKERRKKSSVLKDKNGRFGISESVTSEEGKNKFNVLLEGGVGGERLEKIGSNFSGVILSANHSIRQEKGIN